MKRILTLQAAQESPYLSRIAASHGAATPLALIAQSETLNRRLLHMMTICTKNSRRAFLGTLALGATAFTTRGAFAEELPRTPTTNEGPFYPTNPPPDTDNALLITNNTTPPAVGEITHLS